MTSDLLIDVFSPMPPLRTEIANHTAGVLQALQHLARVRVWTAQEGPVELAAQDVELCRFRPDALPIAKLNEADATFYNFGNNAGFHRDIHRAAQRVPGIIILHDTRLQHFFAAYAEQPGKDRELYLAQLERSHGPAVREMGEQFIAGQRGLQDMVQMAPMTLAALEGAIAAVLHNPEEKEALEGRTHVPLYCLPLSSRFGPTPAHRPPRSADMPSRLVMFGFIGENRRLLPILEALAAMPDRDDYRLDVYGVVEQAVEADALVAASGLSSIVTRHGFVPEAQLDAALADADLALNLRWPSMGEASATQLRIWASACPALVMRVGWYAQLPPDTVFMIEPAQEREGIVTQLRALRRAPDLYARAGAAGRRILEQLHSPERYAEGLLAVASQHAVQHARQVGYALAERAARFMLDLGPPEVARLQGGEVGRRIAGLTSN